MIRDVYHLYKDETVIGRETADIVFSADPFLSRRHAVIRQDGEHWTLTDAGSSNGTRHNGNRITPTAPVRLTDGDEIGIGPVTFVFRTGSP